ncbi:MAG: hypothetical protein L3J33_00685 [Rhodobacteraceae bacterium]|nr:hypothetical protein [Paracoccaceae bacterium]
MKTRIIAMVLAFAATQIATKVSAQEFLGADIQYKYVTNSDDLQDWVARSFSGSVELGFGDFSVQIDGSISEYDADGFAPTFGLHGIYRISDNLRVGAFLVTEDWIDAGENSIYNNYGLEARYDFDAVPVSAELFWVREEGVQDVGYAFDGLGGAVEYTMENGLSLNAALVSFSGDTAGVLTVVGAEYRFENRLALGVKVSQFSDNDNHRGFGVYLNKKYGSGVSFARRDWNEFLAGW